MAKEPTYNPPPPLDHLGDTPEKRTDVEDLRNFLMLIFEFLGGGSDPLFIEQSTVVGDPSTRALADGVHKRMNALELAGNPDARPGIDALRRRLDQVELSGGGDLKAALNGVRQRVHQVELLNEQVSRLQARLNNVEQEIRRVTETRGYEARLKALESRIHALELS